MGIESPNSNVVAVVGHQENSPAALTTSYNYNKRLDLLTIEDRNRYLEQVKNSIKPGDISSVTLYGSELAKVMERNGEGMLSAVRGSSNDQIIKLTTELHAQLNMIDLDYVKENSGARAFWKKIPIIRKFLRSVDEFKIKATSVRDNVSGIKKRIDETKTIAIRDNGTLDELFENTVKYIKDTRELIMGLKVYEQEYEKEIERMRSLPDEFEAYQIADAETFRERIHKRITDMMAQEFVFYQNLAKIRAVQSNNRVLIDRAEYIVNIGIPAWNSEIVTAIIMNNQKSGIEATNMTVNTFNEMLIKSTETLKNNSIEIAKASESPVIAIKTLQETTRNLEEMFIEVSRIHEAGKRDRDAIEQTITNAMESFQRQIENKASGN